MKLGWEEARALRLERHHLHRRAPRGSELRVAGRICGLHAQLLSSAVLSLWTRVEGTSLEAFQRALWRERTLVKIWAMRGTLHLLPARDLPIYLGALGTYRHYLTQGWVKYFGVTREEIELVIETVGDVLRGRVLTRDQLADAVVERTSSKKLGVVLRQGWGVLLKPAAYRGQLCFAEGEGARVRFTHPGPVRQLEPPKALAELARRYLGAYGPAAHKGRIFRPQGWISPALLVDGHVEGVWRHERRKGRLEVRIDPFARQQPRVRAGAAEEAERLAVFLGSRLDKLAWR